MYQGIIYVMCSVVQVAYIISILYKLSYNWLSVWLPQKT